MEIITDHVHHFRFLVFVSCFGGGAGIYAAQTGGSTLKFSKIAPPSSSKGLSHLVNPKKLLYTDSSSIYKCDFSGANIEEVITSVSGEFKFLSTLFCSPNSISKFMMPLWVSKNYEK